MWTLSDGTTISDDAEVTGDSELAEQMRGALEAHALGALVYVPRRPPPAGDEELDPSDPDSLDCWVRDRARLAGVTVTEPAPEPADEEDEPEVDDDQLVY